MQQRYTSESCDGSFSDAHDVSMLLEVASPMWAGNRHCISESRIISSARGASSAFSWRLSEARRFSYSLSAMKLVTVGEQVQEHMLDLSRSLSSSIAFSTISLAMTRSSSLPGQEVAMHKVGDLREITAKAIRYLNVALECKRFSLKGRLGMMKNVNLLSDQGRR